MSKYKGFNYIKRLILIVLLGFIFVSIFAKKVNIQTESKINEENLYLFTGIGSNEINELIFTPIIRINKNGYKKLTAKQIVKNKNSISIKLKKKNAKKIKTSYEELARNTDWEYRFKFSNIKGYDDFVNGISKEIDGIRVVSENEIEFDVYNTDDLSFLTIPNIHTDYKGFKLGDKYVFQNGLNTITIEGQIFNDKNYDGLMNDDTKEKISNISISLNEYILVNGKWEFNKVVESVNTDKDGKFKFENVKSYIVNKASSSNITSNSNIYNKKGNE